MKNPIVVFILSLVVFGLMFLALDVGLMHAQGLSLMFEG